MPEERRALHQLTSWKEIAEHLHVAVRTAQAWERERGLPVNRMPGKKGRVNADPVELDHWKQSVFWRSHRFSNPRYYKIFAVLLSVLLITAAARELIHFLGESRDHSPATTRIEQQPLVVVDHSKNELSRKTISKTDQTKAGPRESRDHSHATTRIKQQPLVVVDHSKNEHSRKTISKTDRAKAGPHADSEFERMITFQDVDGDGELETILHYSPVKLQSGPNISPGVNEEKEQGQSLAAAPPPTSESSIPTKP